MSNRVASGHAEKCTLSKALLIFLGDFLAIFVCRLHIGVPLFFCHLVRKSILIVQWAFLQVCMLTSAHHMNNLILWIKIRGDCYLLFCLVFEVMGNFNQSIGNNFCYISYSITKPFSLRISLDSGSILECQLYLAIFCMICFK